MSDLLPSETDFRIGRVASQTFGVLGRNFGTMLVLCLIAFGTDAALSATARQWFPRLALTGGEGLLGLVISDIVNAFLVGSVAVLTFGDLAGNPRTLQASLTAGLRLLLPLSALNVLLFLGIGIGAVLLLVPGIVLWMRWFVAGQARAVEGLRLLEAFSRSADLTHGYRWKLLGLSVVFIVGFILVYAIPLGLLVAFAPDLGGSVAGENLYGVLNEIPKASFAALSTIGSAVTYTELRRVKEGGLTDRLAAIFE